MIKKLLLTAGLLSTTYGADTTLITGVDDHKSLHADQITIVDSEHSSEKITAALNGIQSILTNPDAIIEELKQAILELSELSYINRLNIKDCGEGSPDNFKLSATIELRIPEIQSFARTHAASLLPQLMKMLLDFRDSEALKGLFLLTAFSTDFTPEIVEIFMSDSALSLIDTWLGSADSLKEGAILFLVCQLINTVQNPDHIAKLQDLTLKHFSNFMDLIAHQCFAIFKLASLESENTSKFIYGLHQSLIKIIYNLASFTSVNGEPIIIIDANESALPKKIEKTNKAFCLLLLLKNYRDVVLNHTLYVLHLDEFSHLQGGLENDPLLKESRFIQEGNPIHRNRIMAELDEVTLTDRMVAFLTDAGLGHLLFQTTSPAKVFIAE
ncbi:hypothetical protein [Candidatus Bodocaedibacter vickermanii]|uniref:Uncharacterized protein n=1 Tax=Candidatus Bodocaedibacter vickermanii TaxID=2741701 RepID=A0A7L9RUI2_9PROT|nr:hypothetical protein CPBP_01051 [Candidatus Paracaedibacteraceae bacterium 'Lake Konstanz']